MEFIVYIVCAVLIYQDFSSRTVSLFGLIALFGANWYLGYSYLDTAIFQLMGINSLVLIILMLSLIGYYSLKNKKVHNILDQEFGKGDALMLVTLIPLFLTINMLMFIIASILLSITIGLIGKMKTIPFAGIIAFSLIIYTLFTQLDWVNGYKQFVI